MKQLVTIWETFLSLSPPKEITVPGVLPEKTLEHWVSVYINYRYRSHASLWWPADGEDILVQQIPPKPGKFFALELKTASFDPSNPDRTYVTVDVNQLNNYLANRSPVAYVFPIPHWPGLLKSQILPRPHRVPDLAFSRTGAPFYFQNWTRVLELADLATLLGARLGQQSARLYRIDFTPTIHSIGNRDNMPPVHWANGSPAPLLRTLKGYLEHIEQCGGTLPGQNPTNQLLRLPQAVTDDRRLIPSEEARRLLQRSNDRFEENPYRQEPFSDYLLDRETRVFHLLETNVALTGHTETSAALGQRIAMFIDSRALVL